MARRDLDSSPIGFRRIMPVGRPVLLQRCGDRPDVAISAFAAAFDREDRSDVGRRAPLIGLLPLRIARLLHGRRQ